MGIGFFKILVYGSYNDDFTDFRVLSSTMVAKHVYIRSWIGIPTFVIISVGKEPINMLPIPKINVN